MTSRLRRLVIVMISALVWFLLMGTGYYWLRYEMDYSKAVTWIVLFCFNFTAAVICILIVGSIWEGRFFWRKYRPPAPY